MVNEKKEEKKKRKEKRKIERMIGCWLCGFYGILTFVGYLMPNLILYK